MGPEEGVTSCCSGVSHLFPHVPHIGGHCLCRCLGRFLLALFAAVMATPLFAAFCHAGVSSANIPLDSSLYRGMEKLSGYGLIPSEFRGIRPYSRAEAARLLVEAEESLAGREESVPPLAQELLRELRNLVPREISLGNEEISAPLFDVNPFASLRLRYTRLDGLARNFVRQVHDPGGDGVFGIGSGLRPDNPYPSPVWQRGGEGTPLFENNEGVRYGDGNNYHLQWGMEGYVSTWGLLFLEPQFLHSAETDRLDLRKGYVKLGHGALELEIGRDAAWFGPGYRGALTLTNNARNFDLIKLSSPEPVDLGTWGLLKYALLASRFERTVTDGKEREPYFFALKLSYKPADAWEIGFNMGKQVGGPGVDNSLGSTLRGIVGGTSDDNSNGLAGFDLRYRASWLRNTEFYGEFSGEDTAKFWPIVESYVAGIFVPNLTDDGRNDLRFEYFWGNQILYTNGTFPGGYVYQGMPIGHSQGGATQDFFFRYSHWFSARTNLALEYIHTQRGVIGKLPGQEEEQKNAWRGFCRLPIYGDWDAELMYGWEHVNNFNLLPGAERTNQVFALDLSYRY